MCPYSHSTLFHTVCMESTEQIESNAQGFFQYPTRDIRRMLVVLAALDQIGPASAVAIENATGHHRFTVAADIERLKRELGVAITETEGMSAKRRPVTIYRLEDWGQVLNRFGVLAVAIDSHKRG
ncbi:hypothetical protein R77560_04739 [Ralstonia thomasii]|jgi:hypothetical protein|uniref:Uncharacterized protein n=2 Tax=Ralstonia TaxID=48736 RepID=A0AAD2BUU8_9RALS|nr:hypothetical protein R77560_04739 [Ralstonia sp. LMG 18095]